MWPVIVLWNNKLKIAWNNWLKNYSKLNENVALIDAACITFYFALWIFYFLSFLISSFIFRSSRWLYAKITSDKLKGSPSPLIRTVLVTKWFPFTDTKCYQKKAKTERYKKIRAIKMCPQTNAIDLRIAQTYHQIEIANGYTFYFLSSRYSKQFL